MTDPHRPRDRPPQESLDDITSTPDVLCVFGSHEDGPVNYFSTEFHLQLPRRHSINLFGLDSPSILSSKATEDIYHVTVTCNGTHCRNILTMLNPSTNFVEFLEDSGEATNSPSSEILKNLCLIKGRNILIFESKYFKTKVECIVFLWSCFDKIVVVDIDGTLTRSDVRGYVETVYLGRYDYIHEGAVTFFSNLEKEFHVCHLYLTSRPLHHLQDTKAFLHLVHDQKGNHLPQGPLFTNKENVIRAIYRELVAKTSAQFKGSVLVDVLSLFVSAGAEYSPFCLGVGNKETDALAYRMASINSSRILLVQTTSTIVVTVASRNHQGSPSSASHEGGEEGDRARPESQRLPLSNGQAHDPQNVVTAVAAAAVAPLASTSPHRTELRFQTYADPSLWQYVKLKMMRNHPSNTQLLYPIPKELVRGSSSSSRPREDSLLAAPMPSPLGLSRARSDNSYEVAAAGRDFDGPPPPPVNFHGKLSSQSQQSANKTGASGQSRNANGSSSSSGEGNLGTKKLKDMTDFFNPVDSADI
jgi:hypothetical protein